MWFPYPLFGRRSTRPTRRPERRSKPLPSRGEQLADEVEAFLAGRLEDHFDVLGREVPAWARLSRLAHATVPELIELLKGGRASTSSESRHPSSHRSTTTREWEAAERVLAMRLLTSGPDAADVQRAQRDALLPLELRLMEQAKARPVSIEEVIQAASNALDEHLLGR
jgi:hypothetical protein